MDTDSSMNMKKKNENVPSIDEWMNSLDFESSESIPIPTEFRVNYQGKRYRFPDEDVLVLDLESLTAEHLSEYILQEFIKRAQIPDTIVKIAAGIDEGPGQGAWSSIEL